MKISKRMYPHLLKKLGFSIFAICAFCFLYVEADSQTFKTLKPGVEYAEVTKEIGGLNVNMNLLRLDLKKVRLDVVHAMDAAIGTEKTSSIATRHKAFAAINAGFFRLDKSPFLGDPVGITVIDGKLLSEATKGRIELLIDNRTASTDVAFARTKVLQSLKIGSEIFQVAGINRERKQDEIVIYTPEFGHTTLTGNDGVDVVVLKTSVGSVTSNMGNSVIPSNGYVISASGDVRARLEAAARNNAPVAIEQTWRDLPSELVKDRANLDVIAGGPQLIRNGSVDVTWQQEETSKSFVETRHPRTAVARLKDGKFLMITVDGRTESSGGIGLQDLAEYLLSLGATDAINLDGGGSTTMFVDGKVVNHPSDKEGERSVSDAILVTLRMHKR